MYQQYGVVESKNERKEVNERENKGRRGQERGEKKLNKSLEEETSKYR